MVVYCARKVIKVKWLLLGLFLVPGLFVIGLNTDSPEKPATVDKLDVDRYLGEWYAIASVVKFFNRDCAWGNMANYSLREDGKIDVVNTCYTKNGEKNRVTGVAWVPDESEPGKLKVSFLSVFGVNLFPANYWVLDLGKDYDYAVVGDPKLSFGWILSRSPEIDSEKLDRIVRRLEDIGYDFSDFRLNPQSPPDD